MLRRYNPLWYIAIQQRERAFVFLDADVLPDARTTGGYPMAEWEQDFHGLMARVREGSEDAAWELVTQYGEAIRRAVRRVLNERMRSKFDSLDFVQIVWNSLFRVRDKLDRFERPEELTAYLVTMAQNKVGMEVRRRLMTQKYNVTHEESLDQRQARGYSDVASRHPAPIDVAIAREQWDRLLQDQPHRYRQIIHLRLQGHTYKSIADTVQLDECTVRRFLKRLLHSTAV
jgi:RNA polymerase sigma factor (sigma-70 family)